MFSCRLEGIQRRSDYRYDKTVQCITRHFPKHSRNAGASLHTYTSIESEEIASFPAVIKNMD